MMHIKGQWVVRLMVLAAVVVVTACSTSPTNELRRTQPSDRDGNLETMESSPIPGTNDQPEVDMIGKLLKSDVPREEVDLLSTEIVSRLVENNNQFAFDFYAQIRKDNQSNNLVISPYSINLALAMVYGGASGETAAEIESVLHYTELSQAVHQVWNGLSALIESRSESPEEIGQGFDLNINNAVWSQMGYPIKETYLDLLARNYGVGLRLADFESAPDESRLTINDWVAEQTQQRITDLIPEGAIHPLTRLALINTVYFKAPWRFPFNPDNTTQELFTTRSLEQIQVPMMHQTQDLPYLQTENLSMVVLPYSAGKLEMRFILPSAAYFDEFEQNLSLETLNNLRDQQMWGEVRLSLPRYQFSTDVDLKTVLADLGMSTAFDSQNADFSGITQAEQIFIDAALHKAYIDVNEEGTEAAAATAILMAGKGMSAVEPVEIRFDQPFFFILQDRETGTILFYGRLMNPLEK